MPRNLMKQLISIKRNTYGQGMNLGITTAPVTIVASSVPAFVQPLKMSDPVIYQQRELMLTHKIYVDTSITVLDGDIINDGTFDYQVVGIRNLCSFDRVWALDCVRYIKG